MAMLAHSTWKNNIKPILQKGLLIPKETKKCNWPDFSIDDRICFTFWEQEFPLGEKIISYEWNNSKAAFILNPNYVQENAEQFQYCWKDTDVINNYANQIGIPFLKKPNKHATMREIVSFHNIPPDALHSLIIGFRLSDEIPKIKKLIPQHMSLYLETMRYKTCERVK